MRNHLCYHSSESTGVLLEAFRALKNRNSRLEPPRFEATETDSFGLLPRLVRSCKGGAGGL